MRSAFEPDRSTHRWHDGWVIVVVEGPSAAGKSTWAASHGSERVIEETGRIEVPGDLAGERVATFWTEANCRRWAEAVEGETKYGIVLCDTDPLKLHYDYCLARIGAASWNSFDLGVAATTDAIRQKRLGLADIVLVSIPDDETLRRRRDSDPSRRRRNFDLHRQVGPYLTDWYSTLDQIEPGRVKWEFPPTLPASAVRERYDVDLFRGWMDLLPRSVISA